MDRLQQVVVANLQSISAAFTMGNGCWVRVTEKVLVAHDVGLYCGHGDDLVTAWTVLRVDLE
jgi:hypothetical protein